MSKKRPQAAPSNPLSGFTATNPTGEAEILALWPVRRAAGSTVAATVGQATPTTVRPVRRVSDRLTAPDDPPWEAAPMRKALYRIPEAMVLLSMSRTVIYEQIKAGRLRVVKEGRATRISAAAMADYVTLLERETMRGAA